MDADSTQSTQSTQSTPSTPAPSTAPRPTGRFAGREAFVRNVREALACAADEGWRELVLVDTDFADWPLHEREVAESLRRWAKAGRRFVMLARSFDAVRRDKPRFVTWRGTWDHLVECRVARGADRADFPSLMWSPAWALRRLDLQRSTGVSSEDPRMRVDVREVIDELLLNSTPGFPASILGL